MSQLVKASIVNNAEVEPKVLYFYENTPLKFLKMLVLQVLLLNGPLYFKTTAIDLDFNRSLRDLGVYSSTAVFKLKKCYKVPDKLHELSIFIDGVERKITVPKTFAVGLLKFIIECQFRISIYNQAFKKAGIRWEHDSELLYECTIRDLGEIRVENIAYKYDYNTSPNEFRENDCKRFTSLAEYQYHTDTESSVSGSDQDLDKGQCTCVDNYSHYMTITIATDGASNTLPKLREIELRSKRMNSKLGMTLYNIQHVMHQCSYLPFQWPWIHRQRAFLYAYHHY